VHTGFWWGDLRERPMCRWEHNIKMDLQEWDGEAWTGLHWLRIWTGGVCL